MEEEKKKEMNQDKPEEKKEKGPRFGLPMLLVLAACLCVFSWLYWQRFGSNTTEPETQVTATEQTEQEKTPAVVTVQGVEETKGDTVETQSRETEEESAAAGTEAHEESEAETADDWKDTVFGTESQQIVRDIAVTGISQAQREASGYQEGAFRRALSTFLSSAGIETEEVAFTGELPCSAQGAYAFAAELAGVDDQFLTVLMYPEYPGRFLFVLQDKEVELVTVQTEETQPQTQAAVPVQPQVQTEAAQVYDASTLSVTGIPSVLANYVSNTTDLQYTLYSWLWNNGHRSVTAAFVEEYSIDEDARSARITFSLSDGGSVTGTYSYDNKTFSYQ